MAVFVLGFFKLQFDEKNVLLLKITEKRYNFNVNASKVVVLVCDVGMLQHSMLEEKKLKNPSNGKLKENLPRANRTHSHLD